ncbi:MAG TPA: hypothetical protein VGQ99_10560 [Tepidisphaeraceae bacterium]|jgi:hypothetical protein|nr:hypothetical protein [Tepidisphaeraceae bacterium]
MATAKEILDQFFLEMRWRTLSLAADLDRVERGEQSSALFKSDPRLQKLHKAIAVLNSGPGAGGNRAEQVQNIFSDTSPPPSR